jgi:hypothetical protein
MHKEAIEWQEFQVIGGYVRRNPAGQYEFGLDIEGGYRLAGVVDRDGAKADWQGDEPEFEVTWREEESDGLPDTA